VESLSELEAVDFPPLGTLEAFCTSGGASTLPRTLADRVNDLDYKTLRYPGHCAAFAAMKSIGLLSEEPIDGVVPRQLTERLLSRALEDDDTDVVLLRVEARRSDDGRDAKVVFELVDRADPDTGHSAMARCTAYSAAAVAHLLGTGAIDVQGVVPGELALPFDAYLAAVRARGLDVQERHA
jgi:lysine 6-dehydrogenase